MYNYKTLDAVAAPGIGGGSTEVASINPGSQEITSTQTIVFSLE
jgi:hypothetical protein